MPHCNNGGEEERSKRCQGGKGWLCPVPSVSHAARTTLCFQPCPEPHPAEAVGLCPISVGPAFAAVPLGFQLITPASATSPGPQVLQSLASVSPLDLAPLHSPKPCLPVTLSSITTPSPGDPPTLLPTQPLRHLHDSPFLSQLQDPMPLPCPGSVSS